MICSDFTGNVSTFRIAQQCVDSTKAIIKCPGSACYTDGVMVVYAEQILFDNLCVDGVLMYSVCRILCVRTRFWRIFVAALLGSIAALLAGIFGGWVAWTAKAVTAPAMVALSGCRYSAKKYFSALGLMLILTFSYGGLCYLLLSWIGLENMTKIPIGVVTLCVCMAGIGFSRFLIKTGGTLRKSRFVYRIALTVKGERIETEAYLDSGNALTAEGVPVLVADVSVLKPILGDELDADVMLGHEPKSVKGEFVDVTTMTGKGKIFVFRPDKLEIYSGKLKNTIFDVMVGLDFVRPIADCRVLLSPGLVAEVL